MPTADLHRGVGVGDHDRSIAVPRPHGTVPRVRHRRAAGCPRPLQRGQQRGQGGIALGTQGRRDEGSEIQAHRPRRAALEQRVLLYQRIVCLLEVLQCKFGAVEFLFYGLEPGGLLLEGGKLLFQFGNGAHCFFVLGCMRLRGGILVVKSLLCLHIPWQLQRRRPVQLATRLAPCAGLAGRPPGPAGRRSARAGRPRARGRGGRGRRARPQTRPAGCRRGR